VLALLPPRTLAVSRCVCREWRDVVDADARCQLRTDLLPLSVASIFVETNEAELPDFFVRPSMARKIASGPQSYLKMDKDYHGLSLASISNCCLMMISWLTRRRGNGCACRLIRPCTSKNRAQDDVVLTIRTVCLIPRFGHILRCFGWKVYLITRTSYKRNHGGRRQNTCYVFTHLTRRGGRKGLFSVRKNTHQLLPAYGQNWIADDAMLSTGMEHSTCIGC